MFGDDAVRATQRPLDPVGMPIRRALREHGLRYETINGGQMLRVRSARGRAIYIEEQPEGASANTNLLIHADGLGAEPSRQYSCYSVAMALYRVRSELAEH